MADDHREPQTKVNPAEKQRLAALEAETDALRAMLVDAQAKEEAGRRDLAEARRRIAALERDCAALTTRLAAEVGEIAPVPPVVPWANVPELEAEIDALRSSTSWRITAPLRAVVRRIPR